MAFKFKNDDGRDVTLLNPSERSKKFATELKEKKRYTNDGELKKDKDGKPLELTAVQRAYRSGYLNSRKDNAGAYNSNLTKKAVDTARSYKASLKKSKSSNKQSTTRNYSKKDLDSLYTKV